jgi:hypothetical protein
VLDDEGEDPLDLQDPRAAAAVAGIALVPYPLCFLCLRLLVVSVSFVSAFDYVDLLLLSLLSSPIRRRRWPPQSGSQEPRECISGQRGGQVPVL